jgi:hypothetical protein
MAVWLPSSIEMTEVPPNPTIASTAQASASHCWRADSAGAINDGIEPKSSFDHDIPRLTWWDHRGTTEWMQLDLAKPTTVSSTAVYWFDDTGRGQCRIPASWRLMFRVGGKWQPVNAVGEYRVAKDQYNHVKFEPLTTDALRIEVQLREGFSGGILEWNVE